jgi:leader peptidase (prepilin peptidase)/N-methyltransferase
MISGYTEFFHEFPWFLPVAVTLFGAIVGSFLNVVIHRVPAGVSIVRPGSRCACGAPIAWYDNLPVLSWFILRGRARCCGRPYSFRYAFVEMLTAALFLGSWLAFPAGRAVAGWVFLAGLVCATFIDLDHMVIPDAFTIGGGVAGVVLSCLLPSLHGQHGDLFIADALRSGVASLKGLLIGSGLVLWVALLAEAVLKKEAMGFGDVKFVGAIGAFCGWEGAVCSLFGGALVGTVWIGAALLWRRLAGREARPLARAETPDGQPAELGLGVHVPFGPMLAIAAALYFLGGHRWADAYLQQLSVLF